MEASEPLVQTESVEPLAAFWTLSISGAPEPAWITTSALVERPASSMAVNVTRDRPGWPGVHSN
jgi:hypothetical protein